ncbi:hypothetical protein ABZS66_25195 [Dactylosporangium sp. NPDC005572]|uniref:hypothetical protein n=1 Tax=Dactylosporangium sp. NPDC005572 TaxID=3156889 RepID=UPI0033ADC844
MKRLGPGAWSSLALSLSQLSLMGTSLVFSLTLAYSGGLAAVGATAGAVLVFQLTCGVLQRSLSEATLLSDASKDRRADAWPCRWAVTAALLGGAVGALVAALSGVLVPDASPKYAIAYAIGIPFAIALDIGRSADVASGTAKAAFFDAGAWLAVQAGLMVLFAALHEPLLLCLSWAAVNVLFVLAAAVRVHRRPALRGLAGWVRSRRNLMGSASLDALLVGLTPVLALQITAFVVAPATLGAVRVLQQVFAPLSFLSITLRRVLIYRREKTVVTTAAQDLRDGVVSAGLMVVGGALLAGAVLLGHELVPALAFIPVGAVLVAAAAEKVALGLSFGTSLSRFVRGEFAALLRARWVMLVLAVVLVPLATIWWGAPGYLLGSSAAMVVYSFVVLALPGTRRPAPEPVGAVR